MPPALATGGGEAKDRALARALSTSFGNGGCARLSFGNGAISLHTRSSVFESLWWVAHGPLTSDRGR